MGKTKRRNKIERRHGSGENIHHLQNKSNNGTNASENLKRIQIRTHQEIHDLFGNQNPFEMIWTIGRFGKQAFNKEFTDAFEEFMRDWRGKAMKSCCYKGKVPYNKGQKGSLHPYT